MFAAVGEHHHLVIVLTTEKLVCTEVYPCAAAHLLVYLDACGASGMEDEVLGIGHARRVGLIGGVYGIVSAFGDVGNPQYRPLGVLLVVCGAQYAARALTEGVVAVVQYALGDGKACGSALPFCLAFLFLYVQSAVIACGIVVDDDVVGLRVTLSGAEDHGTGILEHGGEVGHYDGLRQQVLTGTVERGALPLPA